MPAAGHSKRATPGQARHPPGNRQRKDVTFLRLAFCGELGAHEAVRPLDHGIVRTLWLTPEAIRASRERHRSPLLMRCVDDYLAGVRHPLSVIYTHLSVTAR